MNEFKTTCKEIEDSIWNTYIDESGKAEPIIDGIVDVDKYQESEPKILWILKEPYDNSEDGYASGGGWHFSKDFLAKDDFYKRMGRSRSTWHPVIYVSYGIVNNFMNYNEMKYIRDELKMVDVIKRIAVINVKKLPGFTRTKDFRPIWNAYQKNSELLHKQIDIYNPGIVIGGSTMHLFYEKIGIKQEDIIKIDSIKYAIKNNRIYIDAYHPGQTTLSHEIYVNGIIKAAEYFWTSRKIK